MSYTVYNNDDTPFGEGYTSLIDCINSICTFEYELMESNVNLTKRDDKLTYRLMNMVCDDKGVTTVFFNGVPTFIIRKVPVNQTGKDGLVDETKGFVLLIACGEVFCVPKKELWLKFLRLEENYSTTDVPCDAHGNVFEWFNLLYTEDGNILSIDEVKWYVNSDAMLDDKDMMTPTYEQSHRGDHVGNLTMLSVDRLTDFCGEMNL